MGDGLSSVPPLSTSEWDLRRAGQGARPVLDGAARPKRPRRRVVVVEPPACSCPWVAPALPRPSLLVLLPRRPRHLAAHLRPRVEVEDGGVAPCDDGRVYLQEALALTGSILVGG